MPFAYYQRLNRTRKRTYRQSDALNALRLPASQNLQLIASALSRALKNEDKRKITQLCREIASGICSQLKVQVVRVRVLAQRPSDEWEELHGLYEPEENEHPATITVWMRTAQRQQVVAYRTFLRTLLHELCHHLDYEHLGLDESFHTAGFYQRESDLLRQLVAKDEPVQGSLF
jgi:hypothetical protein